MDGVVALWLLGVPIPVLTITVSLWYNSTYAITAYFLDVLMLYRLESQ
jgi:hypothetical protein